MDHTKLTQSLEDYLEMVHMLRLANGLARVKDIAAALGVKMPSVAKAMVELKKMGLVRQEPYSGVELTEEGGRDFVGKSFFGKKTKACQKHKVNRKAPLKSFPVFI